MQDKNDTDLDQKKRLTQRRTKNVDVADDKRSTSRRVSSVSTDEKRSTERRQKNIPVEVDNRKGDRRAKQEPVEKRVRHRRNSSIGEATDNPSSRFKSGVDVDVNKRQGDRRADPNKTAAEIDALGLSEAEILKLGNRKRERRNATLRGEPPKSPLTRFKSGVPTDSDQRSADRRAKPISEEDHASPEALDAYKKIEKRKTDRRISAQAVDFSMFPNKEDRRKGDRREKALLNRRDDEVASGISPEADRRAKYDSEPIPVERRNTAVASGFRPDLNRRKNTPRVRLKLDNVSTGTEENLDRLKLTALDDSLFVTGKSSSEDSSILQYTPVEKAEKKAQLKQCIRTGTESMPLKKK